MPSLVQDELGPRFPRDQIDPRACIRGSEHPCDLDALKVTQKSRHRTYIATERREHARLERTDCAFELHLALRDHISPLAAHGTLTDGF